MTTYDVTINKNGINLYERKERKPREEVPTTRAPCTTAWVYELLINAPMRLYDIVSRSELSELGLETHYRAVCAGPKTNDVKPTPGGMETTVTEVLETEQVKRSIFKINEEPNSVLAVLNLD